MVERFHTGWKNAVLYCTGGFSIAYGAQNTGGPGFFIFIYYFYEIVFHLVTLVFYIYSGLKGQRCE